MNSLIQILDFLAFHPIFGPWAIIIGECMKDVGKFFVVLRYVPGPYISSHDLSPSLFVFGYALACSVANQPFGFPEDYVDDEKLNPDKKSQLELFEDAALNEGTHPLKMIEVLFFALFGITDYDDASISKFIMPWTFILIKVGFLLCLEIYHHLASDYLHDLPDDDHNCVDQSANRHDVGHLLQDTGTGTYNTTYCQIQHHCSIFSPTSNGNLAWRN